MNTEQTDTEDKPRFTVHLNHIWDAGEGKKMTLTDIVRRLNGYVQLPPLEALEEKLKEVIERAVEETRKMRRIRKINAQIADLEKERESLDVSDSDDFRRGAVEAVNAYLGAAVESIINASNLQ